MNNLSTNDLENIISSIPTNLSNLITEMNQHEIPEFYEIRLKEIEALKGENLIFTCKYNWRTIRIIQSESLTNNHFFKCKVDDSKQLTIQMDFSKKTIHTFKFYLRMWLVEQVSKQGMHNILIFTNQNMLSEKTPKAFHLSDKNTINQVTAIEMN